MNKNTAGSSGEKNHSGPEGIGRGDLKRDGLKHGDLKHSDLKHDGLKRVELIITIVERGLGNEVTEMLRDCGVTFNLVSPGYGAAGMGLVDILGFSESEKDIVLSVTTEERVKETLNKLKYKFDMDENDMGIAFSVPIFGVNGPLTLRYISGLIAEM